MSKIKDKLIPPEYSPKVAANKSTLTAIKSVTALALTAKAMPLIQSHVPDHAGAVAALTCAAIGGLLEGGLDFLKMHFPNALKWLR